MAGNASVVDISLRVRPDGTQHIREVGQESRKAGREVEQSFERGGRSVGGFNDRLLSTRNLLTGLGVGVAVYQLQQLGAQSLATASNLEEASSKYETVFAGQVAAADEWVRTLTDSYAMSTRESREYLAAVQDLLVPMGMQSTAAAQLSNEIVKLSADLGSFNNRSTEEVMLDIQSALVGNFETMKKYGVVLSATTVQERVLADGYADTKDEIIAADKALAAYQIMMEGSTAALGDMERTADGYANTSKRLSAEWEDFSAVLGNRFLPAATHIKGVTADILDNLTRALGAGADTSLSGIDAEISRIEKRIRDLTDHEARRKANAEHAAQIVPDGSPVMTVSSRDVSQLSALIEKQEQYLAGAEVAATIAEKSAEQRALEQLESEKTYLQDLKRFKQLEAHQDKMTQVAADSEKALAQGAEAKRRAQAKADKEAEKQRVKAEKEAERAAAAEEKRLKYVADRTAEITLSETEFKLRAIEEQARADKEAGVNEVAVANWVASEKARVMAEAEQKRLEDSIEWSDGAVRGLEDYATAAADVASGVEEAFQSGFQGMEDALVRMVSTGKLEFSDLANSIISDLARIAIRQQITGPMAAGLSDFVGNMWGSVTSTNAGAASMVTSTAPAPMTMAPVMHTGGVVGMRGLPMRMVPSSLFDGAPRHHTGLGPKERPVILEDDEIVIPAARAKNAQVNRGGGGTHVEVHVHTQQLSEPVRVEKSVSEDGQRVDIRLISESMQSQWAEEGARGRGPFLQMLENRYGLNPVYGAT